ncbi:MAG: hypothetical protein PF692_09140 [Kiritimatiellae bacterium]|jgi:G3E family GTPase|nr:hypothetical protein [Kiritimatiellia bacterium]
MSKTPIILVSGFLGAGKTTFLKNYINQHQDDNILYIINEFSSLDVDGQILVETEDNILAISGGSIFCKCLVSDFISMLETVREKPKFKNIKRIMIEASGMANPKVIADMLRETKLDTFFELQLIISIIDSNSFLKLIHTLPNIITQVEAADIVFINKTDIHSEELVSEAYGKIKEINDSSIVIKTKYGHFENSQLDIKNIQNHSLLHGEFAKCKDPNFDRYLIDQKDISSVDELKDKILNFEKKVYRAKGYFKCDGKGFKLEYEGNDFFVTEETTLHNKKLGIVLITAGVLATPAG